MFGRAARPPPLHTRDTAGTPLPLYQAPQTQGTRPLPWGCLRGNHGPKSLPLAPQFFLSAPLLISAAKGAQATGTGPLTPGGRLKINPGPKRRHDFLTDLPSTQSAGDVQDPNTTRLVEGTMHPSPSPPPQLRGGHTLSAILLAPLFVCRVPPFYPSGGSSSGVLCRNEVTGSFPPSGRLIRTSQRQAAFLRWRLFRTPPGGQERGCDKIRARPPRFHGEPLYPRVCRLPQTTETFILQLAYGHFFLNSRPAHSSTATTRAGASSGNKGTLFSPPPLRFSPKNHALACIRGSGPRGKDSSSRGRKQQCPSLLPTDFHAHCPFRDVQGPPTPWSLGGFSGDVPFPRAHAPLVSCLASPVLGAPTKPLLKGLGTPEGARGETPKASNFFTVMPLFHSPEGKRTRHRYPRAALGGGSPPSQDYPFPVSSPTACSPPPSAGCRRYHGNGPSRPRHHSYTQTDGPSPAPQVHQTSDTSLRGGTIFYVSDTACGVSEENTELIDMCADVRRLPILEALYIKEINPKLNVQANDLQALPSMNRTKANNSLLTEKQSEESTTNKRLPLTETRSRSYLPISAATRLHGRQTSSINSVSLRN
ncbi:hypothetical protein GWK47_028007 [Chionoecetes opilio]|uniref:Uncharacterized protein n=1 Tax=Chionoecetes opilio TaxID=41210 RepID=A0A8J4YXS1_CHIOP|nr:hypothetical protein GWK47_028007 [Chionoecetes opilio]